ncbi:glycosyltransferase family 2 protein [Bifidobacterium mongoliense]|nr:glycosyltransferase family 2 protein [Bifidobacterium mongoliense]
MATYNGSEYIGEQIESIIQQTFCDWNLLISDDGSEDNTLKIIEEYVKKDDRIKIVSRYGNSGSPKANFMGMIHFARANYIAFADQDDVWEPNKLELLLRKMKQTEIHVTNDIPLLVFSDLMVVDSTLKEIDKSYFNYMRIDPYRLRFSQLLVQNTVTGCSCLLNKSLYTLPGISEVDVNNIVMHDWLFALLAAIFGRIEYINIPLTNYRQHGDNSVGALKFNFLSWCHQNSANRQSIEKSILQAKELLRVYGHFMPLDRLYTLKTYALILNEKRINRSIIVLKKGYLKSNLSRKLGQLLFIALL